MRRDSIERLKQMPESRPHRVAETNTNAQTHSSNNQHTKAWGPWHCTSCEPGSNKIKDSSEHHANLAAAPLGDIGAGDGRKQGCKWQKTVSRLRNYYTSAHVDSPQPLTDEALWPTPLWRPDAFDSLLWLWLKHFHYRQLWGIWLERVLSNTANHAVNSPCERHPADIIRITYTWWCSSQRLAAVSRLVTVRS